MTGKRNIERRLEDLEARTRSVEDDHLDALAAEAWENTLKYIGGEAGWERLSAIATDELGMSVERDADVAAFHTAVGIATAHHQLCNNVSAYDVDGPAEDVEGLEAEFREQYPDCLEFERSWRTSKTA